MKKGKKILLSVLVVLLIAAAGIGWRQRDNIMAIMTSFSYSRDDIRDMMASNDVKVADVAKRVEGVTVRDLTDGEKQALKEGKMTQEELVELLTKKEEPGSVETAPAPAQPTQTSPVQEEDPNRKKLSEYVARIYLMKAEYTAWLEDKYDEAIAEYKALEEAERTTAAKYEIGLRCMNEALEKEKECDARMAEIEQQIKGLLIEMGEDTSLVDEIQAAYEEEKELKKAYYLGLHD